MVGVGSVQKSCDISNLFFLNDPFPELGMHGSLTPWIDSNKLETQGNPGNDQKNILMNKY